MNRRISLLMVMGLLIMAAACKKQEAAGINPAQEVNPPVPADGKYPVITFEEEEYDFGTIKQGDKVVHIFKFKNTGEADLQIISAKGSCGCTVPEPPTDPIKPGESNEIKVSFNSAGKEGEALKTVTVMCNTKEGNKLLKIKANIEVPKKD